MKIGRFQHQNLPIANGSQLILVYVMRVIPVKPCRSYWSCNAIPAQTGWRKAIAISNQSKANLMYMRIHERWKAWKKFKVQTFHHRAPREWVSEGFKKTTPTWQWLKIWALEGSQHFAITCLSQTWAAERLLRTWTLNQCKTPTCRSSVQKSCKVARKGKP